MPEDADKSASKGEGRRKARWREADVMRAIAAARKARLSAYRVEIAPDGTIAIVVGTAEKSAGKPRPARR